jgi:hypothetical protein
MTEQDKSGRAATGTSSAPENEKTRNNQENELEAEQESAEAMDAEVPQPPGANETTEGQPS